MSEIAAIDSISWSSRQNIITILAIILGCFLVKLLFHSPRMITERVQCVTHSLVSTISNPTYRLEILKLTYEQSANF